VFDRTGTRIAFDFDIPTDRAGIVGVFGCEALLTVTVLSPDLEGVLDLRDPAFVSEAASLGMTTGGLALSRMLGDGSFCSFFSSRGFSLTLGFGALLPVGQQLDLLGGKIRRETGRSFVSSGEYFTEVPADAPPPVANVRFPQELGLCDDLMLDASASTGGAGRKLRLRWELKAVSGIQAGDGSAGAAELGQVLAAATENSETIVRFPRSKLQTGAKYTINLIVTNFYLLTSSLEEQGQLAVVTVSGAALPVVEVQGGTRKQSVRSRALSLSATGFAPACNADDIILLSFTWQQLSGPSAVLLASTSDPRRVTVPAGEMFPAVEPYRFSVTATVVGSSPPVSTASIVTVRIVQQSMAAFVAGGDRSVGVTAPLLLSAAGTVDPDIAPNARGVSSIPSGGTHVYTYEWECSIADSSIACDDLLSSSVPASGFASAATAPSFTVPQESLLRYEELQVDFSVTVRSVLAQGLQVSTKEAEATVRITVLPGAVPSVAIEPPANSLLIALGGTVGYRVDVSKRTVLRGSAVLSASQRRLLASTGSSDALVYKWRMVDGDFNLAFPDRYFSTPTNQPIFAVRAGAMTPGSLYVFELVVAPQSNLLLQGRSVVYVQANRSPSSGSIVSSVPQGKALTDPFTFRATRWVDDPEDEPFRYSFWVHTGGALPTPQQLVDKSFGTPLGAESELNSLTTTLPASTAGDNFVTVVAYVADAIGSTSSTFIRVQALPPLAEGASEAAAVQLVRSETDKLDRVLAEGSGEAAMAAVASLASLLNAASAASRRRQLSAPSPSMGIHSNTTGAWDALDTFHVAAQAALQSCRASPPAAFSGSTDHMERLLMVHGRAVSEQASAEQLSARSAMLDTVVRAAASTEFDSTSVSLALGSVQAVTGVPEQLTSAAANQSLSVVQQLIGADFQRPRPEDGKTAVNVLTSSTAEGVLNVLVNVLQAQEEDTRRRLRSAREMAMAASFAPGQHKAAAMQRVDAALLRALSAEACSASGNELGSRVLESAASGLAAGMLPSESAQSISAINADAPLCGPQQRQGAVITTQVLPLSSADTLQLTLQDTAAEVSPDALTACGIKLQPFGAAGGGDTTSSRSSGLALPPNALGTGQSATLQVAELRRNPFCAEIPAELGGLGATDGVLQPTSAATQGSFVTDLHLKGPSSADLIPFQGTARPVEPVMVQLALTNVPGDLEGASLVLPQHEEEVVRRRALQQDTLQSYGAALLHGLGAQEQQPRGAVLKLAGSTLSYLGRSIQRQLGSHDDDDMRAAAGSLHLHLSPRQAAVKRAMQRSGSAAVLASLGAHANFSRRLSVLEDTLDIDAALVDLERLVQCPDNSTDQEGGSPYLQGKYIAEVQCPTTVEQIECLESSGVGNITYTCPLQAFTAGCVWYNPRSAAWDTEGCVLAALTNTHMTCACDHLTSFSARFSRMASSASSDFSAGISRLAAGSGGGNSGAGGGNGTNISDGGSTAVGDGTAIVSIASDPYVVILVSLLAVLYIVLLAGANIMDAAQTRGFLKALGQDEEVALVRHLNNLAGRPFKLASHLDDSAEAALLRAAADEQAAHGTSAEQQQNPEAAQQRVRDTCPCGLGSTAPACLVACLARSSAMQAPPAGVFVSSGSSSQASFEHRIAATFRGVALSDAALGKGSIDEHLAMSSAWKAGRGPLQSQKQDLDRAATGSHESLSLFTRLWQMRWFAARTAWLRIAYNHRVWSLFTRFDHRLSRAKRITIVFVSILAGLAAAALLFDVQGVVEGQDITFVEVLVFALVALVIQIPLTFFVAACLNWSAAAEFANTYTDLYMELHRRRTIEQQENNAVTKTKPAQLQPFESAAPSFTRSARVLAAAASTPPQAGAAHDAVEVAEWEPANERCGSGERAALLEVAPQVVPTKQLRWEMELCSNTRISCALTQCCPRVAGMFTSPEHPNDSDVDTDDELNFGWVDAPLWCTQGAPWCVQACGRHPEQRATWLRKAREADFEPWGCCWVGSSALPTVVSVQEQQELLAAAAPDGDGDFNARASKRRLHARRAARMGTRTHDNMAVQDDSLDQDVMASMTNPAMLVVIALQSLAISCTCKRRAVLGLATPATAASKTQWAACTHKRLHDPGVDANARKYGRCESCMAPPEFVQPGQPVWWCGCLHHCCPDMAARGCLWVGCCVTQWAPGRPVSLLRGWETSIAWLSVLALVGLLLFYILLFGLSRGDDVMLAFMETFGITQLIALLVLQPALILLGVVWGFVLAPVTQHYFAWIPIVRTLMSPSAQNGQGAGSSLSGRLQHITMVQASGRASGLSRGEALLAFSDMTAISAAMSAGGTAWKRRQEARAFAVALRLARNGDDSLLQQLRSMPELQTAHIGSPEAMGSSSAAANAFHGASASADASHPPGGDGSTLVSASRSGGGGGAAAGDAPTDGRAGALVLAAPASGLHTGMMHNAGMPSKAAPVPSMTAGPGVVQRKVSGGTDYSKLSPQATANIVVTGKAPAPDTTAEMRQQMHLVQVYLHKVFPRQAMTDAVSRFNAASRQGMPQDRNAVYNRTPVLSDDIIAQNTYRVSFQARRRWVRVARMATSGVLRQRMVINQQLRQLGMLPELDSSAGGSPSGSRRQRRLALMQEALAGEREAAAVEAPAAAPQPAASQVQPARPLTVPDAPTDGAVPAEAVTVPALRGDGPTFIVTAQESSVSRRKHTRSMSVQPSRSAWQQAISHITVDILAKTPQHPNQRSASVTRRRTAIVKVPDAVAAAAHMEPADWEGMRNMRFEQELGGSQAAPQELASPRGARASSLAAEDATPMTADVKWNASSRRVVFLQPAPARAAEAQSAPATRDSHAAALLPMAGGAELHRAKRGKVREMYTVRNTQHHSVQLAVPRISLSMAMPPAVAPASSLPASRGPSPELRLVPAQEVRAPSRAVHALDLAGAPADAHTPAAMRLAHLGVDAAQADAWGESSASRGPLPHAATAMPQEITSRRIYTVRATHMSNGSLALQIPTARSGRITVVLPPGAVAAAPVSSKATRSQESSPLMTVVGEASGSHRTQIRSLDVTQVTEHQVSRKRIAHLLPPPAPGAGVAKDFPASRGAPSELQTLSVAAAGEVHASKLPRNATSLQNILSSQRGARSSVRVHLVLESFPMFKGARAFTAPAIRGEGPPPHMMPTGEASQSSAGRDESNLRPMQAFPVTLHPVSDQLAAPGSSQASGVHAGPPTPGMRAPQQPTPAPAPTQGSAFASTVVGSHRSLSTGWSSDEEL